MVKCLVVHRIGNDFSSWKKVFDSQADKMQKAGCLSYSTGTVQNDSRNVYVLADWDTDTNFNKFFQSNEIQEIVKKSGVIGEPQVTLFTPKDQKEFSMTHATHH